MLNSVINSYISSPSSDNFINKKFYLIFRYFRLFSNTRLQINNLHAKNAKKSKWNDCSTCLSFLLIFCVYKLHSFNKRLESVKSKKLVISTCNNKVIVYLQRVSVGVNSFRIQTELSFYPAWGVKMRGPFVTASEYHCSYFR